MKSLFITLTFFLLFPLSAKADAVDDLKAGVTWNYVAKRTGLWHDPDAWVQNQVPPIGANVRIPAGIRMSVSRRQTTNYDRILVEGTLRMWPVNFDSEIRVDTLLIDTNGVLLAGTATEPIPFDRNVDIVIVARASVPLGQGQKARGIVGRGEVKLYGQPRTTKATLAGNALAGNGTITLTNNVPDSWKVGDEIVITSTHYNGPSALRNEVRTISSKSGKVVTLNQALAFDHKRPAGSFKVYVGNLTRQITIKSQNTSTLDKRGHVMLTAGSDVVIEGARFLDLGRSDKAFITDLNNPEGRYSLHFHRNAYSKKQEVRNCVIQGTPGWGLVNHSSWVVATDNYCHDFAGAGFVSEAGDELGGFSSNLASGGSIAPTHPLPDTREMFGENEDRMKVGDMGFSGIAYWMVSPFVRMTNNIAAGGKGTAFFYFPSGKKEGGEMIGLQRSRFPAAATPRTWVHENQHNSYEMGLSADYPLRAFHDNTGYGCLQGYRSRWVNHPTIPMYNPIPGADVIAQIQAISATPGDRANAIRVPYTTTNNTFWNCHSGISMTYSRHFTVDNFTILNDQLGGQARGGAGINAVAGNNVMDTGNLKSWFRNSSVTYFNFGATLNNSQGVSGMSYTNCNTNEDFRTQ